MGNAEKARSVLVVVPDPTIRASLRFLMEAEGFSVETAAVLAHEQASGFGCVVVDGIPPARIPRRDWPPMVILIDDENGEVHPEAVVLQKPVGGSVIAEAVARALGVRPGNGRTT